MDEERPDAERKQNIEDAERLKSSLAEIPAEDTERRLPLLRETGFALRRAALHEQAEACFRERLEIMQRRGTNIDAEELAVALWHLGSALDELHRLREAETLFRRALHLYGGLKKRVDFAAPAPVHYRVIVNSLGSNLAKQGSYEEAEGIYRHLLWEYEELLALMGRMRSESMLDPALAASGPLSGFNIAHYAVTVARLLFRQGKAEEARDLLKVKLRTAAGGEENEGRRHLQESIKALEEGKEPASFEPLCDNLPAPLAI